MLFVLRQLLFHCEDFIRFYEVFLCLYNALLIQGLGLLLAFTKILLVECCDFLGFGNCLLRKNGGEARFEVEVSLKFGLKDLGRALFVRGN